MQLYNYILFTQLTQLLAREYILTHSRVHYFCVVREEY